MISKIHDIALLLHSPHYYDCSATLLSPFLGLLYYFALPISKIALVLRSPPFLGLLCYFALPISKIALLLCSAHF